jgi:hypothetical protein
VAAKVKGIFLKSKCYVTNVLLKTVAFVGEIYVIHKIILCFS